MDVYIGFGLLAAGIVVLIFMIFDGWLKNRNARMTEMSGLHDKTSEDPEFTVGADDHDLHENFIENVSLNRASYNETRDSGLADLCEGQLEPAKDVRIDWTDEEETPVPSETVQSKLNFSEELHEEGPTLHTHRVIPEKNMGLPPDLLVLSVMAKNENRFESYDLLQAISAAGLQFGEMNIFHYYHATPVGKITLFSLASANKPGDFDLNNFAEFSCSGLILFIDMAQVPDPQFAFKMMMDAALRLVEDLDGTLCAAPMVPWNEKIAWQYHQKIMQHKTAVKHDSKNYV
ncbi:MAG TPA: cell division protein ZipA C-terminal FtsZ-binding domain-containing protein [Gammaproteobacteria bacterium]|nr:cell division protein ZipA C-terminal FtsZ-binding domain-containing protein [Gammaproteobacteria bacterium]